MKREGLMIVNAGMMLACVWAYKETSQPGNEHGLSLLGYLIAIAATLLAYIGCAIYTDGLYSENTATQRLILITLSLCLIACLSPLMGMTQKMQACITIFATMLIIKGIVWYSVKDHAASSRM